MRFSYYDQLSVPDQRIYRLSDEYDAIELTDLERLRSLLPPVEAALAAEYRDTVETACNALVNAICENLNVHGVAVAVEHRRPSDDYGDLHGLYESDDDEQPWITVWMRTAKRDQVVAFRTFLRTLLHEACHHLDYELLELEDSFHTEGFFQRESSLFRQLVVD